MEPQLIEIEVINAARRVMNKREINSITPDYRGFLFNALSLQPMEYVDRGDLVLLSPVDAERLAELWGTEVVRTGEFFWRVRVPEELMAIENAYWESGFEIEAETEAA